MINSKIDALVNTPTEVEYYLANLLDTKTQCTIFDIGACTGEDSVRYAKLFPKAQIHAFEPRADNLLKMREIFQTYAQDQIIIVPIALSDFKGESKFYLSSGRPEKGDTDWDYGNKSSSLLPPSKILKEHFPWLNFDSVSQIMTDTLDNYCLVNKINSIDFVHMDVQGAEFSVLKGGMNILKEVSLIWLEVENVPLYENQPLKVEIEALLNENKFIKIKDTSIGKSFGDCLFLNKRLIKQPKFYFFKYIPFRFKMLIKN